MLPVQISLQQLLAAIEDPRNHGLDFGQNQFRKGWYIAELEFEWVVVAGVCEDILTQNIRKWCYVELVFWQKKKYWQVPENWKLEWNERLNLVCRMEGS